MNGFGLDAVAAIATTDADTLNETARKIAAESNASEQGADVSTRNGWQHHLRRERPGDGRGTFARVRRGRRPGRVGTGRGIEDLVTEPPPRSPTIPSSRRSWMSCRASTTRCVRQYWASDRRGDRDDRRDGRVATCAGRVSRRPALPRAARRISGHSRQSPTNAARRQDRA